MSFVTLECMHITCTSMVTSSSKIPTYHIMYSEYLIQYLQIRPTQSDNENGVPGPLEAVLLLQSALLGRLLPANVCVLFEMVRSTSSITSGSLFLKVDKDAALVALLISRCCHHFK
eukprot:scpid100371/ scgid22291/ 